MDHRGETAHKEAPTGGVSVQVRLGAGGAAEAMRVDVVKPRTGGLVRRTAAGDVDADRVVDLYAKVSGFLKTQEVDIGSR